jgi:ribonuclease HII
MEENLRSELDGVNDSKKMTPNSRDLWALKLKEIALDYAVGFCSNQEIDRMGIIPTTKLAVMRALEKLTILPQHLLVDYIKLENCEIPHTSLVKGDARSLSIACASILAKTERDALMRKYAAEYPLYGFERNKGYATHAHRQALVEMGPCPIHRKSFRVKGLFGNGKRTELSD